MSLPAASTARIIDSKEYDYDIEDIIQAMIRAAAGKENKNDKTEDIRWEGRYGKLRACAMDEKAYLVHYSPHEGTNKQTYLFEIHLLT